MKKLVGVSSKPYHSLNHCIKTSHVYHEQRKQCNSVQLIELVDLVNLIDIIDLVDIVNLVLDLPSKSIAVMPCLFFKVKSAP